MLWPVQLLKRFNLSHWYIYLHCLGVNNQSEPRQNMEGGLWLLGSIISLEGRETRGGGAPQQSVFHCDC